MGWCKWFDGDDMYRPYHQAEWGRPCHDDRRLFEYLMLECLQCGLSWSLIMGRRPSFDMAFVGWDYDAIAAWDDADKERCLSVDGMLRSPRKVDAVVGNARAFVGIREEFGSFDAYLWGFTNGRAIVYDRPEGARLPSSNGLSAAIATDLRARGFSFVGPTTVYAFLQGVGVVCDHDGDCPIGREILAGHPHELRPADGEVL